MQPRVAAERAGLGYRGDRQVRKGGTCQLSSSCPARNVGFDFTYVGLDGCYVACHRHLRRVIGGVDDRSDAVRLELEKLHDRDPRGRVVTRIEEQ